MRKAIWIKRGMTVGMRLDCVGALGILGQVAPPGVISESSVAPEEGGSH